MTGVELTREDIEDIAVLKDAIPRMESKIDTLTDGVGTIKIDIAKLKIKSGIWGAMGGAIPVAIILGVWLIRG